MNKLYIIIPAYNEQETIETVIRQWYPIVVQTGPDSRLVVVNDGSTDGSYEIMKRLASEFKQFIALTKSNQGHGATVLYGYNYALEHRAEYVFQTDSDGQTRPEEFDQFWNLRDQYDLVIGNRVNRQDGISRIFVTKVLKLTIRICFGISVTDANTPYRLMKADVLAENIELIPKDFNLSNVILTVIYTKKGLRIKYLPITFQERQGGVNSINIRKITKIGWKALKDFHTINQSLK